MCACLLLCGCEASNTGIQDVYIKEQTSFDLIVDRQTGIVYIDNNIWGDAHGHVYTPYYSANGNLYRYDDGVLIEVKDKIEN